MYRVYGHFVTPQRGGSKLYPSPMFQTFKGALEFQTILHAMMVGKGLITHVEAYSRDHIPAGWCQVANTTRG
jgi:hypothetical protein